MSPLCTFALVVCHQKSASAEGSSKMEQPLIPIAVPSKVYKACKADMKGRLNTTMGRHTLPPEPATITPTLPGCALMTAMQPREEAMGQVCDNYSYGIQDALYLLNDVQLPVTYF